MALCGPVRLFKLTPIHPPSFESQVHLDKSVSKDPRLDVDMRDDDGRRITVSYDDCARSLARALCSADS